MVVVAAVAVEVLFEMMEGKEAPAQTMTMFQDTDKFMTDALKLNEILTMTNRYSG